MDFSTEQTVPRRNSRLWMIAVLATALVISGGIWFWLRGMTPGLQAKHTLADYGTVPDITLTERSGRQMSLGDLKGSIWIADFIFTRCGGTCQIMSSKMSDLQKSLKKADNVKLVSITVDPENDTPAKLTSFAEGYQADAEKWLFLTGDKETVQNLAKKDFKLTVQEGTDPKEPIVHSKRFVLVDEEGHIRGYYDGTEAEANQKLLVDLGVLIREND